MFYGAQRGVVDQLILCWFSIERWKEKGDAKKKKKKEKKDRSRYDLRVLTVKIEKRFSYE